MSLPVSFLSDFGRSDEFVGVVHGVIAKLSPESRVIDVNHEIAPGNVRSGALALMRSIQYLPEGVMLAVVDPGVGTDRRAIAARTPWGFFVGPDNGLLSPAVALSGGADVIVAIENPEARIPSPGETFHGRDVFGPAAALLASGESPIEDLGPVLPGSAVVPLLLPLPDIGEAMVTGEIWWVDRFGNCQTNIGPDTLVEAGVAAGTEELEVRIGSRVHDVRWVRTYGDVDEGELCVHVDSSGLIALAVRGGNAADMMDVGEGIAVTLSGPGARTTTR